MFVTTAAADPWITFTHSAIYTELVNELLNGSVTAGDEWMNLTVGDRLDVPASVKLTGAPTLLDPAAAAVPLTPAGGDDGASTYRSPPLAQPGLYQLSTGGGPAVPVSVTVPAEATDVRAVDDAGVRSALGNLDVTFADDGPPPLTTAAAAASLDQGWNVMLLVFLLVAGEAFLAMRFGHHRKR